MARTPEAGAAWPELDFHAWQESGSTLHMWLQIVGKVRLVLSPPLNHSWHATFYVTSRGITTSPIPYGARTFQVDLDFLDHRLTLHSSDGRVGGFPLEPRSVAEFHERFFGALRELGVTVKIDPRPNEVPDPIPFAEDDRHRSYDADRARAGVLGDDLSEQFGKPAAARRATAAGLVLRASRVLVPPRCTGFHRVPARGLFLFSAPFHPLRSSPVFPATSERQGKPHASCCRCRASPIA